VPAACSDPTYVNRNGDTVPNPLYSGPIPAAADGGTTSRRPDIATTSFAGPAVSAQGVMSSTTYGSFQGAINGPHGTVHGLVGGQMGSVPRAGFDPIFYLHHCNVDRLWWNWQVANPGASMPSSEAGYELDPFNRPYSTDWYVGADMESTDDLGYRYSNWCFWLPPIKIWEVIPLRVQPWVLRRIRNARLVIRSSRMARESVEFRVFINKPKASHTSKLKGRGFAGSIGTFGMGDMEMEMEMESRSGSRSFDLELNITERLKANVDKDADEVQLKIVALDGDGEPVDAERLDIDDIELILE
jgi:hypothetical protein